MFNLQNKYVKREEVPPEGGGEGEAPDVVTSEQFSELKSQFESVMAKNSELLGEAKSAKQKLREFEQAKEQELAETAKQKGDYEQLYKSAEQKAAELEEKLNGVVQATQNEKRTNAALKVASEIAEGYNVELLAEQMERRLKYVDGSIKVLDENGELSVMTTQELANEFKTNPRYSSLVSGSKSNGGGATGNNGGSAAKEITRADFDKMPSNDKMKYIKSGGKVT